MTDLLVIPDFVPAALTRRVRVAYDGGLRSGRVRPTDRDNGRGRKTVIELRAVTSEPAVLDLPARIAVAMRQAFPGLPPLALDTALYTRLDAGGSHELHADNRRPDGSPNHTPHRVASAMLYLTDAGEHGGGVIRFPDIERDVAPRPGLLVGFPAEYRHAVTPVVSGPRDALAVWFREAVGLYPVLTVSPTTAATTRPPHAWSDPWGYMAVGAEGQLRAIEYAAVNEAPPAAEQVAHIRSVAGRWAAVVELLAKRAEGM